MRYLKVLIAVLALSLCLFATENPFSGTWKLNLEKSKLPSPAVLKSDVVTIDANDDGAKYSDEAVTTEGRTFNVTVEPKWEGKYYPVTGDPTTDSESWHRVNSHTMTIISKNAGKLASQATAVVSKDGRVTTVTFTDYSQGKPIKGIAVYDKQ